MLVRTLVVIDVCHRLDHMDVFRTEAIDVVAKCFEHHCASSAFTHHFRLDESAHVVEKRENVASILGFFDDDDESLALIAKISTVEPLRDVAAQIAKCISGHTIRCFQERRNEAAEAAKREH